MMNQVREKFPETDAQHGPLAQLNHTQRPSVDGLERGRHTSGRFPGTGAFRGSGIWKIPMKISCPPGGELVLKVHSVEVPSLLQRSGLVIVDHLRREDQRISR